MSLVPQTIGLNDIVRRVREVINANADLLFVDAFLDGNYLKLLTAGGDELSVNLATRFATRGELAAITSIGPASEDQSGILRIATDPIAILGEDDTTAMTPLKTMLLLAAKGIVEGDGGNGGNSGSLDGSVMNMATQLLQLVGFAPEDIPQGSGTGGSTVVTETDPLPSQSNFGPALIWENGQKRTISNDQLRFRIVREKSFVWSYATLNTAPARFYRLAKLPKSASGTWDGLEVKWFGGGLEGPRKSQIKAFFSNRQTFTRRFKKEGNDYGLAALAAYLEEDGSVTLYQHFCHPIEFGAATVSLFAFEGIAGGPVLDLDFTPVATPTGKEIFSTRNVKPYWLFDGDSHQSWQQFILHNMAILERARIEERPQAPTGFRPAAFDSQGNLCEVVDQGLIDYLTSLGFQRTGTNLAPILANKPTDQTATVGQNFTFSLADTFTDPENGILSLNGVGLPPGLTLNSAKQIVGNATTAGVFTVTVTATDPATNSTPVTFKITVLAESTNVPQPPPAFVAQRTAGETFAIQLQPFTHPGGLAMTNSWVGNAGITLDADTLIISGSIATPGTYKFLQKATDTNGNVGSVEHTIVIGASSGAALVAVAPDYNCSTGALKFKTTGGNGSTIEYSATGITGWTTNPNHVLEAGIRNDANSAPLVLKARQSGIEVQYTFDFHAFCSTGTPTPVTKAISRIYRTYQWGLYLPVVTGGGITFANGGIVNYAVEAVGDQPVEYRTTLPALGNNYGQWATLQKDGNGRYSIGIGAIAAGQSITSQFRIVGETDVVTLAYGPVGSVAVAQVQVYPEVTAPSGSDVSTTKPSVGNPDPLNPIFVPSFQWVTGPDGEQWLQIGNSVNPPASFGWKYTVDGQAEPNLPTLPQHSWAFVEMFDSPGYDPQNSIVGGKAQLRIYIGDPSGPITTQNI